MSPHPPISANAPETVALCAVETRLPGHPRPPSSRLCCCAWPLQPKSSHRRRHRSPWERRQLLSWPSSSCPHRSHLLASSDPNDRPIIQIWFVPSHVRSNLYSISCCPVAFGWEVFLVQPIDLPIRSASKHRCAGFEILTLH